MAAKASGEERKIKLAWKRGDEAPGYIMRGQSAVEGAMVYFLHDFTNDLYAYDSRKQQWVWTLECPYYNSSLAMVKGLVTAIGGNEGDPFSAATNKLMSLVDEGGHKVWHEKYPPMPSKRYSTTAVTTGDSLIVAGGRQEIEQLATVEVMNLETLEWYWAKGLPNPLHHASSTVCGDKLYILGAHDQDNNATPLVFSCSLTPLLQSSKLAKELRDLPLSELIRLSIKEKAEGVVVWGKIADTPLNLSTCATVNGQLLAVGGQDPVTEDNRSAVYHYKPTSNSWEHISDLPDACMWCHVAVLPGNKMMVVYEDKSYFADVSA